ncbi:PREDICTED: transcription factor HES-5-like [Thamnophis sirtalis]|uniref:Transcription factor HES-5 n=1 Tax=Thamnophis sirtalis TaxID=35019 RepID=A0A6I9YQ17_9SAUR|nr:PREDICTED: transcription factor HES-5-like [Thamnophis sirtalis]
MAPAGNARCHFNLDGEKMLAKEKNKLRKPVVEKMRRDRINSSIEQLKVLLEREFQCHQPNTKLEKADILETAVSYLKKQHQMQESGVKNPEFDFHTGYLRCLREAFCFLSFCQTKKETQARLIKHFCKIHTISDATFSLLSSPAPKKPPAAKKPTPPAAAFIWRPW